MRRFGLATALILAALCPLAGGCGEEVPSRELLDWELEVDGQRGPFHMPSHIGHGLDDHPGAYTLRARVELDPAWRGKNVTLTIPIQRTVFQLRANGRDVPYLDEHIFDVARIMSAHRFRIDGSQTEQGVVELELRATVQMAEASWWDVVPTLALGDFGDRKSRMVNHWNTGTAWISLVSLLTLALVYWMLHISAFLRRAHNTTTDNKNTEFAKVAGGSALYPMVQIGLLQPLIGRRDLAMLIMALLITMKASVQLVRKYLALPLLPKWTDWAMAAMALALVAMGNMFVGRLWVIMMVVLIGGVILYMSVETCMRAAGHGARPELWVMIALWIAVTLLSGIDVMRALGFGAPLGAAVFTCAGLLIMVTGQAFLLSRDHTDLLLSQSRLNKELAGRVGEVETLNEELRRKVGDRSRELSAALRKMRVEGEGDLQTGAVLSDRYRVVSRLGAGAMGAVYRVERLADGRSMAAKVVRGRVRPDTLERFTREAELTARVDHPNVVRVFDVDVTSDGELFLVMELVEGRSLEDERARFGDAGFAEAVVRQITAALQAIHAAGIVHRDLKPSNVLVSMEGGPRVKVADFGIAGFGVARGTGSGSGGVIRPAGPASALAVDDAALDATIDAPTSAPSTDPRLTATGAIMGTPLYMAPEVLHGTATIGPEADLFSLGLIAYQMFGGPPIEREGTGFRRKTLVQFSAFAPGLSAPLAEALQRCLHQDPTMRPTAQQLAELFATVATRAVG